MSPMAGQSGDMLAVFSHFFFVDRTKFGSTWPEDVAVSGAQAEGEGSTWHLNSCEN